MSKSTKILAIILVLFVSQACMETGTNENTAPKFSHKIQKIEQSETELKMTLNFSREDINLKGPSTYLSQTDLPKALQLSTLNIYKETSPDTIYACEKETVPYICKIPFTSEEYSAKIIINAEFTDGQKYTSEIRLPEYPRLEKIAITAPTSEIKDKSILEFKNVFADTYLVKLHACYKTLNDAAPSENDCKNNSYKLNKNAENKWEIRKENPLSYSADIKLLGDTFKLDIEYDPTLYVAIKYEIYGEKTPFIFQGIEILNYVTANTILNF